MSIEYRIIESAPLPEKAKKERKTRQKRDFSLIPVGGAGAFAVDGEQSKKHAQSVRNSIAQQVKRFADSKGISQKAFKVSVETVGNGAGGTVFEVWVRHLDTPEIAVAANYEGNGGAPAAETLPEAAQSNAETLSNGAYDYSSVAAE